MRVSTIFGVAMLGTFVFLGCASKKTEPVTSPEPMAVADDGVVIHEDDRVVEDFKSAPERPDAEDRNTRASASSADPRDVAKEAAAVQAKEADQPEVPTVHKTSMPGRQRGDGARLGGVRKAVPVDRAASVVFGMWKVDKSASSSELLEADRVLFLDDGRMRVWRGSRPEDGRWTWTMDGGVKTGGLNGVAFSLGDFEMEGDLLVLSTDPVTRVVLTPDRVFISPKRKSAPVAAP